MKRWHAAELQPLPIPTADGVFVAHYSTRGLAQIQFPVSKADAGRSPRIAPEPPFNEWHQRTTRAIQQLLVGSPPDTLPPLDLSEGTAFQRRVWNAMQKIPFGQTSSYGALATAIGKPGAGRAVGNACGANPIPLLIPCHRVLAAGQKIGGFSGGLDWKRKLLAREGTILT